MPPVKGHRVMIVAGEASGDSHAGALVEEVKRLEPTTFFFGMGGPRMAQAGVRIIVDCSRLAVVGIIEAFSRLPQIAHALLKLRKTLKTSKPDLLVLVDYAEFNLKLAETARALGIKVLFYISPQVWAWRPGRASKLRQKVDMMAVLFPFEVEFYQQYEVPVSYVGHPVVGKVQSRSALTKTAHQLGLDEAATTIGLLPGSRPSEIKHLLPVFLRTARLLQERLPAVQFALGLAPGVSPPLIQRHASVHGIRLRMISDHTYDLMRVCDALIVASGTATLEAALIGTPMVIVYKLSPLTHAIVKRLLLVPHIGLPNILAGECVVREFIQSNARPNEIADEVGKIVTDLEYRTAMRRRLMRLRENLGPKDGSRRLAELLLRMLNPMASEQGQPAYCMKESEFLGKLLKQLGRSAEKP